MKRSLEPLHSLAARLVGLQKRAKTLGLFANDRELLACPRCGLLEDVTSAGRLITCRADSLGEDTGLRFVPLADNLFRCPSCAQRVKAAELEKTRKALEARKA